MNAIFQKDKLKIGLLTFGFSTWGGGIDFIKFIGQSLASTSDENSLEIHVFISKNLQPSDNSINPLQNHILNSFKSNRFILHFINPNWHELYRISKELHISILLPSFSSLPKSDIPWIGYLYDFQHKYLPNFFNESEKEKRDSDFALMLTSAPAILVNSVSTLRDCRKFFPKINSKVFSLPFTPAAPDNFFNINHEEIIKHYKIERPYFIISNQFWIHKDHQTAYRAFSLFIKKYPDFDLICTGATTDYRFPNYFEKLTQITKEVSIDKNLKILGHIPKNHQIALVKGSVALIQPTLFEGGPGGGSTYDAISIGKRVILSDIDVNREITDELVYFFESKNPNSLATKMFEIVDSKNTQLDYSETYLKELSMARLKICGLKLLEMISKLIN